MSDILLEIKYSGTESYKVEQLQNYKRSTCAGWVCIAEAIKQPAGTKRMLCSDEFLKNFISRASRSV